MRGSLLLPSVAGLLGWGSSLIDSSSSKALVCLNLTQSWLPNAFYKMFRNVYAAVFCHTNAYYYLSFFRKLNLTEKRSRLRQIVMKFHLGLAKLFNKTNVNCKRLLNGAVVGTIHSYLSKELYIHRYWVVCFTFFDKGLFIYKGTGLSKGLVSCSTTQCRKSLPYLSKCVLICPREHA